MEVVEHVEQLPRFMQQCCARISPGGLQFVATINRTLLSLIVAKWGAEYVLRWLPRGTHAWRKFVRPEEVAALLRAGGLTPVHATGVIVNPFNKRFSLTASLQVNYMMVSRRDA
jgi:2-polyprenyl-6-hydroxyphenyl methylase/3-demethylubiquinone-9 3-methyltransferase